MIGPADIDAWREDMPEEPPAPARPTAAERAVRRRVLLARLAHGRALSLQDWRDLRASFLLR